MGELMRYSVLLFDADNTVLDFNGAEEQALKSAFEACCVPYSREVLAVYRKINIELWQKLEKGEMSVEEVLYNRFELTAEKLNLRIGDIKRLSDDYEKLLHFGFGTVPHAEEVLRELKQRGHRLYIVSNGVLSIQNARMRGSGLDKYFLKRFVSSEIGCPKPNAEFFYRCFEQIPNFSPAEALVIGDSLSSDIRGGVNVGLDTCWFNPEHLSNPTELVPTFEIADLRELLKIV